MTYHNGLLKILRNGIHEINCSTHVFHRFLSTKEKSIRLATLSAKERLSRKKIQKSNTSKLPGQNNDEYADTDLDSDLTICETKGTVIDADMCLSHQSNIPTNLI